MKCGGTKSCIKKKPNGWKGICAIEMHKVTKERVVDGFFCFLIYVSVCLFDVENSVEGVCGVLCVSNVQR